MSDLAVHPFANLTPDVVLNAVEALGLPCDGRLLTLNSYENRVYQVGLEDQAPCVVKFYRPERWSDAAILEEHQFTQALAEAEIPAVPPLQLHGRSLHQHQDYRLAVFVRRGGRAPELSDPQTLTWLGRYLGRLHLLGQSTLGQADLEPAAHASGQFRARPTLNAQTYGHAARADILAHQCVPADLLPAWLSAVEHALQGVARCYERAGPVRLRRLHGDCHPGNVLWTPDGPHFVDFDDCCNGPALQDLWMLLSGSRADMAAQLRSVLAGYEQFCSFNPQELHLLEALRTLRLLHYSAWIAKRWHDPAFPAAFPQFGSARYWQDRILELHEQLALMDEAPLEL